MPLRTFTDQLNSEVQLNFPPQRIISLVPSQTELLADLHLEKEVAGITRFCVHPKGWRQSKIIVGGTKKFDFDTIQKLKPDLIIGNKEENYREGIERLKESYPVWMSDITSWTSALAMIYSVGEITNTAEIAAKLAGQINDAFSGIQKMPGYKTLYLIWRKPWMGVGSGTFIHDMLAIAGLTNVLASHTRYPQLGTEELINLKPELILLSSEPYPFAQKHIDEIHDLIPSAKTVMVNGQLFSWYGSRLLKFPDYVAHLKARIG